MIYEYLLIVILQQDLRSMAALSEPVATLQTCRNIGKKIIKRNNTKMRKAEYQCIKTRN